MTAVGVHAVVSGAGPVVVLSNSLGSTHRMWDAQVADLEQRFTVVRYDTRGHGASPVPDGPYTIDDLADDLIALLDRLDLERAHLVGLSLGGMTAMRVAARNPERVDRMALLCTGAQLPPATAWVERAATVRAQGTAAVAAAVVDRWFTDGYDGDRGSWQQMVAATPPRDTRAVVRSSPNSISGNSFPRSPPRRWPSREPTTRPPRWPSWPRSPRRSRRRGSWSSTAPPIWPMPNNPG